MDILLLIASLIILIYSAILHEIAHGFVADRLGDPTARLSGRLTLNPIPHIDPYMSVLLPLMLLLGGSPILFGGAKPVPVDPFNLKEGKKDLALVSLAGPLTNILITVLFAVIIHALELTNYFSPESIILQILFIVVQINIVLAIFNLLPIPPLDGSKVFSVLLPDDMAKAYLSLGQFGIFILFLLLFFPIGPFSLQTLISYLYRTFAALLGF
jgi:Zn-dependent protease